VRRISADNKKLCCRKRLWSISRSREILFNGVPENSSWQLSADIGFLCDKATVLGDVIKGTLPSIAIFVA